MVYLMCYVLFISHSVIKVAFEVAQKKVHMGISGLVAKKNQICLKIRHFIQCLYSKTFFTTIRLNQLNLNIVFIVSLLSLYGKCFTSTEQPCCVATEVLGSMLWETDGHCSL